MQALDANARGEDFRVADWVILEQLCPRAVPRETALLPQQNQAARGLTHPLTTPPHSSQGVGGLGAAACSGPGEKRQFRYTGCPPLPGWQPFGFCRSGTLHISSQVTAGYPPGSPGYLHLEDRGRVSMAPQFLPIWALAFAALRSWMLFPGYSCRAVTSGCFLDLWDST